MADDDLDQENAQLRAPTPQDAPGWRSRLIFGLIGAAVGGLLMYVLYIVCMSTPTEAGGHGISIQDLLMSFSLEFLLFCLAPIGIVLGAFAGAVLIPDWLFKDDAVDLK